jgi:glutamate--cysteine ligase
MPRIQRYKLSCPRLADYFRQAFRPREEWMVGVEVERMGRDAATGRPLRYEGAGPSVRGVLTRYAEARGGSLVLEGDRPIGIDGSWGGITLEPGGQVEWSSRPAQDLSELATGLDGHLAAMRAVAAASGAAWLDVAVDPVTPVAEMPWMPKARYGIMREILARRGRLAHRMMTQTASIQCAFDYASDVDWSRKFRAAALMTPIAVALFANSSRVDGAESGWASYRQAIWRETDPDRCDLPDVVFDRGFDIDAWVEWVCDVPTLFLRRGNGLIASGGEPLRALLANCGCDAVTLDDWELHLSSIFTEVRSYSYLEVRSADLLPEPLVLAVPALWTGILYDDDALDVALAIGRPVDSPGAWRAAMGEAARRGLSGTIGGRPIAELAGTLVARAAASLRAGGTCAGPGGEGAEALARLARFWELPGVRA